MASHKLFTFLVDKLIKTTIGSANTGLRNINKSPIVKLTGYTAKLVLRDVSFEL